MEHQKQDTVLDRSLEAINENGANGKDKKVKKRTKPQKNYPQYSVDEALVVAKTIAKNNAGNPWDSEQVAVSIEMGAKASNFYYLTAASRDYGFTTGTSRTKEIELTALGRKAIYPENLEQEYAALKQAFGNIDIFKQVYNYYKNGTLPEKKYLYNTLQETFGIIAEYHDEFYDVYSKNIKYLKEKESVDTSISTQAVTQTYEPPHASDDQENTLFVIMPFSEKTDLYPKGYFDEVFSSLIVPAASIAGFSAKTANKNGSDIIHKTIVSSIYNSSIILADLTEHNPNVLFELGLAIAFKKKVAIIRAKGTKPIFDVDNSMRVLDYSPNLWKSTLEMDVEKLAKHITATIASTDGSYLDIFLNS